MKKDKNPKGIPEEVELGENPFLELSKQAEAVQDENGVSFTKWAENCAGMFKVLRQFAEEESNSSEPGSLSVDSTKASAWFSYALARQAEAEAFESFAVARVKIALRGKFGDRETGEIARVVCRKLISAPLRWGAVAEGLKEKMWTARGLLKPMENERRGTR